MRTGIVVVTLLGLLLAGPVAAADPAALLQRIKGIGREGAGNSEAQKAWAELVRLGPAALPTTLAAFDDATPTAANWLRSAAESIVDQERQARRPLPREPLEAFVRDTRRAPAARRLAYEWLVELDPTTAERLLPGMLQDPSVELRRDAVARVIRQGEELLAQDSREAAREKFQEALAGARDRDQVDLLAKQLKGLGVNVDLAQHFGYIRNWQVIAPFDNTNKKGFAVVYPPEKGVDLQASYEGKQGAVCTWKPTTTTDPYGLVDLNKVVGKHMGVVGYAFAAVDAPMARPIEVRATSKNAVKIWLNGQEIHSREEYHHGARMDQHVGRGELKPGRNEILIKVCQNEQTDSWAQEWEFSLRVCDAVGGGVPVTILPETLTPQRKNGQ